MNESERALAAVRVVAKLPTIAAMAYRHSVGLPYVAPRRGKSFAANLLNMCFASPLDGGEFVAPPAAFEKALDVFLLLHADHEQNASTSTVRMASSSQASPFACVAAGIASLWGPAHGGANEAHPHAARDREQGEDPRVPGAGQGQERPVQAHGVWPPRGSASMASVKLHAIDATAAKVPFTQASTETSTPGPRR